MILYIVWALFVTATVLAVVHAARTTKRDEQQVASWPKGAGHSHNPADPSESLQVSSAPRTTLGCLVPFFAVFALASLWFISILPVG